MSTKKVTIPFKEYESTINKYSRENRNMEKEYKSIIESETGQALYEKKHPSMGAHADLKINSNIPIYNKVVKNVKYDDKTVPIYKEFWQYKQPAGTMFTDWNSSGISHVHEALSVRHLPLYGDPNLNDPSLILSNVNNIRNNLQRYGKEYLTSTNMLNAEQFNNGISYGNGGKSTYRNSSKDVMNQPLHGSFGNAEHGDLYARNENVLRVDLPDSFVNTTLSSWMHTNPSYVQLLPDVDYNGNKMDTRKRIQFGTLNLDSMLLTGKSCLTNNFGVIPDNMKHPVGVFNDQDNFPPVTNIDYYNNDSPYYLKEKGKSEGLYCSANTNFVTMPINYLYKDLDTSFSVAPGNNSVTIGAVMNLKLKEFINTTLYKYNRDFIFMSIFNDLPVELQNKIKRISPYLFNNKTLEYYNNINDEGEKYKYVFNIQRNLITLEQGSPHVEYFINNLSIVKMGGNSGDPNIVSHVICSELSESPIEIKGKGAFVLLPTMLAEDLFTVAPGENCIESGATYEENAYNCAFNGHANMWQQKPQPGMANPTFVPNMFDDSDNLNNFIYNLSNPYGSGNNYYDAPLTF